MRISVVTVFITLLVFFSLHTPMVQARDTAHLFSAQQAVEMGKAKGLLGNDIEFYFSGQAHPPVAATLSKGITTNKKTNRVNKSNEEACHWVMLSALIQLQESARESGGNAVINIESYYKKKSFKSSTQFECYIGKIMAGVALKGDVVKLEAPTPKKKK